MTTRLFIRAVISTGFLAGLLVVTVRVPGEERQRSTSIGNPNEGGLKKGVLLPDRGTGYYMNPGTTNRDARYGTDELIGAIIAIGEDMERLAPGATLVVNDLGLPEGGPIPHHQSHQAGRDVDLLFYMVDGKGKMVRPRAVRFDETGKGAGDDSDIVFDTERNWLVLRSLIENRDAHLQRVFVAERLRKLMLDWARDEGEPPWIIERAGEAMCEPAVPHDDHFHVRLFCTAEDYALGCRDSWPIFPWRRTELSPLGITDVETAQPRPRKKSWRRRYVRKVRPGRVWCP